MIRLAREIGHSPDRGRLLVLFEYSGWKFAIQRTNQWHCEACACQAVTSLSVADFAQSDEVHLTDLRVNITHQELHDTSPSWNNIKNGMKTMISRSAI